MDSVTVHAVEPAARSTNPQAEKLAGLALTPILTTGLYYALPPRLQFQPAILFLPQVLAYVGLTVWIAQNDRITERLGLTLRQFGQGLRWGAVTGLALGLLNVSVILLAVPWLGGDIEFLRQTPHARVPVALVLPWTILLIAVAIELNFRGFLLGRLLTLCENSRLGQRAWMGPALAVGATATAFAFDPFMVVTFKHLHWIAMWDGIVWGTIWLRMRNLWATIVAHAVEVMIMYIIIKIVLET